MSPHTGTPSATIAPRIAVFTLSDRIAAGSVPLHTKAMGTERGEREDLSGATIVEQLAKLGAEIVDKKILPDDREVLRAALMEVADHHRADVVITTGGTGLGPRDVTPEATLEVIDRRIPGMEEAMRQAGLAQTPYAMLSRAVCGMRRQTIIINLPGSPKGVRECLSVIMPVLVHAVELVRSPAVPDSSHQWK